MARFGADDGYCLGPAEIVFPALEVFEREIREHYGLHLAREKSEIFTWDGNRPPGCLPGLKQAGVTVGDTFQPGMVVYGCPCGTDSYVEQMLVEKGGGAGQKSHRVMLSTWGREAGAVDHPESLHESYI